jgi:phosphonate transport system substrate-binding protein
MKSWRIVGLLLIILNIVLFIGCDSSKKVNKIDLKEQISNDQLHELQARKDADVFLFGFDLRRSPQEDARQYLPFLNYLQRATGYRFELRFTSKYSNIIDDLGKGIVHFAAIGAGSYVQARAKYAIIPLVSGVNAAGKSEYQSVIVVQPNSPIRKIEDLRGKRLAFGSASSTQGYIIPMIVLSEHGISLIDLASYEFAGSHENCANAVIAGRADACGMQDTLGLELSKKGLVRIVFTSRYYPSSGISANKSLPPEVISKVRQAMLDFQPGGRDAAALYDWNKTEMPNGFTEARDKDYEELYYWMKKLGFFTKIKM